MTKINLTVLEERLEEQKSFKKSFVKFIQDKSISLDHRWAVFRYATSNDLFVEVDSCYISLKALPNVNWYDHFYYERHKTVSMTEVIDKLEEDLEAALNPNNKWGKIEECLLKTQEEIDALKEEMLATGYSAFVYDW